MRRDKEEFDWIDDPFDEKKAARDRERAAMSGGSKAALGCGCLVAAVVLIALAAVMLMGLMDVLAA